MNPLRRIERKLQHIYRLSNARLFGRDLPVFHAELHDVIPRLKEAAFYPPDILHGNPTMKGLNVACSTFEGMHVGVWECSVGRFRWNYDCDEAVYILHGRVVVTVGDKELHLVPGSIALFPIGTSSEWLVTEPVRKVYFLHHPTPIMKKVMRA